MISSLWQSLEDVTHHMSCDMYFSLILMLGWLHFQNGVTQGVQVYFEWFLTFVTCDVWHVMCGVTHHMSCDIYFSPMFMLGWWHFQNGVTQGVQVYFLVICDICDMWCVTCDVWCNTCHALWHVLHSHVDAGVVTFLKWCHTWGPWLFSSDLWHLWHVMCDMWCVMWHMTCPVTCIVFPCWYRGGDISKMVSH